MTNLFNLRTLLFTSAFIFNTYILSSATINFFYSTDPFIAELHSYNFGSTNPDIWTTLDMIQIENLTDRADLFISELQHYNYGSTYPEVWTSQDALDLIKSQYQLARFNLNEAGNAVTIPPIYENISNNVRLFPNMDLHRIIEFGNLRDYISPDDFPNHHRYIAYGLRDAIIEWSLRRELTIRELTQNSDFVLIRYPLIHPYIRFLIETPHDVISEGFQSSRHYDFYMLDLRTRTFTTYQALCLLISLSNKNIRKSESLNFLLFGFIFIIIAVMLCLSSNFLFVYSFVLNDFTVNIIYDMNQTIASTYFQEIDLVNKELQYYNYGSEFPEL